MQSHSREIRVRAQSKICGSAVTVNVTAVVALEGNAGKGDRETSWYCHSLDWCVAGGWHCSGYCCKDLIQVEW